MKTEVDAAVSLREALNAYQLVIDKAELDNGRGCIELLGWNIEYVDALALASFIDQLLIRRLNDFVSNRDDPLIIDCGANIGLGLLNYKRQYPQARIIAFEPDVDFLPCLHANLLRNNVNGVEVVEAAAWTEKGEISWLSEGRDGSRIIYDQKQSPSNHVQTIDLEKYLQEPVDLLKLDIEGAEYIVVPHIQSSLKNVDNIVVECHLDQENYSALANIIDSLKAAGFDIAINTYGGWRDLLRQPAVLKDHWQQYALICGWRSASQVVGEIPGDGYLPYVGPEPILEEQRTLTEMAEYLHEGFLSEEGRVKRTAFPGPYHTDGGLAFIKRTPVDVPDGDSEQLPRRSRVLLFEDGKLLGPGHVGHDMVRQQGFGRYSHWGDILHFSSSDGSDPNYNGRCYTLVYIK